MIDPSNSQRYRTVNLQHDVYRRLAEIREAVGDALANSPGLFGLTGTVKLLIAAWERNPPPLEWIREHAVLMPRRGRPPQYLDPRRPDLRPPDRRRRTGEHTWIAPLAQPELFVCKWCGAVTNRGEIHGGGKFTCWKTDRTLPMRPPTPVKVLLEHVGFTAAEIAEHELDWYDRSDDDERRDAGRDSNRLPAESS